MEIETLSVACRDNNELTHYESISIKFHFSEVSMFYPTKSVYQDTFPKESLQLTSNSPHKIYAIFYFHRNW